MHPFNAHSASTTQFDAFEHWWRSQGKWVEAPNQRRGGESGVLLLESTEKRQVALYCKRQVGHTYRSWRYPQGRPTILRELQAYAACARLGIRTPALVYGGARRLQGQWQALLVTEALHDYVSLEHWYERDVDATLNAHMLQALGSTLARLHAGRWQHGCCYAKHIFIRTRPDATGALQVDIALLDLEKSRRRWRTEAAASHDLRQLGRHRGNMPAADLQLLLQAHAEFSRCHSPQSGHAPLPFPRHLARWAHPTAAHASTVRTRPPTPG